MNQFPVLPVGTKVLIEPIQMNEEKSEGGIVMSNTTLSRGKIVSVSSSVSDVYKIGDIVLYPPKKGMEHVVNGSVYRWLDASPQAEEIWGIVLPETKKKGGNQ